MAILDSVHRALHPAARSLPARLLRTIHVGIVCTGIAAVILGSVSAVTAAHGAAVSGVTAGVVVFFSLDYAARLAAAPRNRPAGRHRPWAVRLAWAVSAEGLVDFCTVVPLPLAWLAGVDPAFARLFGILWVLRLARYSPGLGMLGRVLRNEREALLSVSLFFSRSY